MAVSLEAIKFNHQSGSVTNDAFNIRKNKTTIINTPEWVRGINTVPEDSLAAYAIKETSGNTITIQARFKAVDLPKAEIRAIDPSKTPPDQPGCLGLILKWIWALIRALLGNVLGEVEEKWVTFNASGDSGFVTFNLKNTAIGKNGVGIHYTEWQWQYRLKPGGTWKKMQMSKHKIYVVLEVPKDPWVQTPGSDHLPWTEVMDFACQWASGAKTQIEAATKITQAIYNLGPSTIEYDCPGGGGSRYSWLTFNCTAFLERLKGGPGNGQYVNCSDCATFVSTFANVLGCTLWQSRMESSFGLNPLLAIGSAVWQPACGWSGFSYHEVAWTGDCDVKDPLYDACLQVDGDANPTSAPHTELLPVNMIFGNPGDGLYRDRLVTPPSRPNCNPVPKTRKRRQLI